MRIFEKKKLNKSNNMTLSELLYGFFEFWANFDYDEYQISLNSVRLNTKKFWQFDQGLTHEQLTFVIQDPIETKNNCAKNVRPHTANLLINEFKRAQLILLYGGDWIDDVCSDTIKKPHCSDHFTLKKEITFYQKQNQKQNRNKKYTEYIQQYVASK